ncbi:DUF6355 family natural product biosynthesis protein [Amycolatopsis sp. OK19-0408]|uniref:DUF6355 family natural product biosynthesis protein n=1 Tax=Amycolatopsis iheyensis TaxID=2945988 RepID=A0A9X2NNB4_9PSEU|nr:DUF6355 family natural product biosynthesis protein [Amycolatopsis iheyensis]MCR6490833.1 DUF6355 family natural product biosynthesis protein [Amycolatopsis iheyensis]
MATAAVAAGSLLTGAPAALAAAPSSAATAAVPCGYREQAPFAFWYNCRSTNVKIRVDVILYPDRDYCTLPGDNLLDSGSSRTRGAKEIGGC